MLTINTELTLLLGLIISLYVAWNIGANDVANSVGTSVGANIVTYKSAIIIAIIFEVFGATFAGDKVSSTLGAGLLNEELTNSNSDMLIGMISTLMATGIWLNFATILSLPISTTHTMVGAIVGFAICAKGVAAVKWGTLLTISLFWMLSPFCSAIIAMVFSWFTQSHLFSDGSVTISRSKKLTFLTSTMIVAAIVFNILPSIYINDQPNMWIKITLTSILSCTIGIIIYYLCIVPASLSTLKPVQSAIGKSRNHISLRKMDIKIPQFPQVITGVLKELYSISKLPIPPKEISARYTRQLSQYIFGSVQWVSVAFISFVHGANDVANAMGPFIVMVYIVQDIPITNDMIIPKSFLLLGGLGIVVGIATFGWRVVATISGKIVPLTPVRALSAELSTAITVLLATILGIPVSTSHSLVGSLVGISAADKVYNVNLKVLKYIILSWVLTTPMGMLLSAIIFTVLSRLTLLY